MSLDCGATLSVCRHYRYLLWRSWSDLIAGNSGFVMFIGLNPSTADESVDDPTVRRCIRFAMHWGYSGVVMANLFAYRATNPAIMMAASDPIGSENDSTLVRAATRAAIVIAAWGNKGQHLGRSAAVSALVPKLHCLRVTKLGEPEHPLYLPSALTPRPYS